MTETAESGATRPRDPIELQVQGIFGEVLGLEDVEIDVPFLDIGGHSLTALQIQDRMLTDLGVDVPLDALLGSGTVAELAAAARASSAASGSRRLARLGPPAQDVLYCVHSVVGTALRYRTLGRLLADSDVQVRAFQARGLAGDAAPHDDLRAMAAEYVAELRAELDADGRSDVHLLGYSLGALVVFEMAALLRAAGVEVGHVFLVDTYAPVPSATIRNVDDDLTPAGMLGQSLDGDFDLSALDGVTSEAEAEVLLAYARERRRVPDTYTVDDVARLLSVVRAHAASLDHYTPSWERLDVATTLFTVPQDGAPRDMWWSDAVTGDLTVVEVPGPHHRLLDPPNADEIARHVVDVIGHASSRTSAA